MVTTKHTVLFILGLIFSAPLLADDCVILLHGLARSESSMDKMATYLGDEGYKVVNQGYDSRSTTIENIAEDTFPKAIAECEDSISISFVTHSMGGILVRQYLSENTIPALKHVVMLGPPNNGSEVVDKLHKVPGFKFMNGPAGLQLGTGESSVPNTLGSADFSLGIIAGTRSINLILSTMLPYKDDGKVTVESTKLEGMDDHLVMPVTHTFMMKNKTVMAQVAYFLEHGTFERKDSST